MHYRLTANFEACVCEGQTILLDLKTDQYVLLPQGQAAVIASILQPLTRIDFANEDVETLQDVGIIEITTEEVGDALVLPPVAQNRPFLSTPPKVTNVLTAFVYQLLAIWLLKSRNLAAIRSELQTESSGRQRDDRDLEPILAGFAEAERILPSTDKCLRRSLALRLCLKDQCIDASLVIGTRMRPFGAHAWVQKDARVLNDHLDRVRVFTPILTA